MFQTTHDDQDRLSESLLNLKRVPHDILSLKSAALSLAQMSMREGPNRRKADDMLADANDMLALAAELSPAHPEITGLRAELLHMAGKTQEARDVIGKCASHYLRVENAVVPNAGDGLSRSKLASVHLNFARAFMAIEDATGALRQLALSIELAPDVPDAHQTAAAAYNMLGKSVEAKKAMTKANKLISQFAS